MGQAPPDGSQQHSWDYNNHGEVNAVNTTQRMIAELDADIAPSFVLHIGDISYAVGYLSEWEFFTHQVRPIASTLPWMTAIGNHEMGGANTYFSGSDSGGECGLPYSAYYRMPSPADTGKPQSPWYTFRYGLVAFVVMSTEHDFTSGSQQLAWIEAALASVDRSVTPFLVFAGHRPMYVYLPYHTCLHMFIHILCLPCHTCLHILCRAPSHVRLLARRPMRLLARRPMCIRIRTCTHALPRCSHAPCANLPMCMACGGGCVRYLPRVWIVLIHGMDGNGWQ